jgi:hypothetical protein
MLTRLKNYWEQVVGYFIRQGRPSPRFIWFRERVVCPFGVSMAANLVFALILWAANKLI